MSESSPVNARRKQSSFSSSPSKNSSSPLLGVNAGSRKRSFRLSLNVKGRTSSKIVSLRRGFSSTLTSTLSLLGRSSCTSPPSDETKSVSPKSFKDFYDEAVNGTSNSVVEWSCIVSPSESLSSIPEIEEDDSKVLFEQDTFFDTPSLSGSSVSDTSSQASPCIAADDAIEFFKMDDDAAVDEEENKATDTAELLSMGLLGMFLGSPAPSCVAKSSESKSASFLFEGSDDVMPTIDAGDDECSIPAIEVDSLSGTNDSCSSRQGSPYIIVETDSDMNCRSLSGISDGSETSRQSSLSNITGTDLIEMIDNYDNSLALSPSTLDIKGMQE